MRKAMRPVHCAVKLAAIFALAGFAPGMLIYVVSYQFVSRSIESWFDVKVEGALNAGLNLGRATVDTLSADLAKQARRVKFMFQRLLYALLYRDEWCENRHCHSGCGTGKAWLGWRHPLRYCWVSRRAPSWRWSPRRGNRSLPSG